MLGGGRLIWLHIKKKGSSFTSSSSSSSSPSISSQSRQLETFKYLGLDRPDSWACPIDSQPSPIPHFDRRASIIDGKSIGAMIKSRVATEILRMKDTVGKHPGLAVVLVGGRNDSHSFVRLKMKACEQVGIASSTVELPGDCTEDEFLNVVSSLYKDPSAHGVIVQLPLSKITSMTLSVLHTFSLWCILVCSEDGNVVYANNLMRGLSQIIWEHLTGYNNNSTSVAHGLMKST